jgi:hypothetical protein
VRIAHQYLKKQNNAMTTSINFINYINAKDVRKKLPEIKSIIDILKNAIMIKIMKTNKSII